MSWKRRILIAGLAFAAAGIVAFVGGNAGAGAPAAASAACPGQGDAGAPASVQERAMLCLVNQARLRHDLDPLAAPATLARAAARKSADILRCDEFSHEACGRGFTYWIRRLGYRGCREGENIAYGGGRFSTPRSIFQMWMRSTGHRENILGSYEDIGIGLQVGELEGHGGAHVWTQEFGTPC